MPNSVYHESGLTLSLSLSESWNTLLRVAASLIYHLCPGFDPDVIESVSSSPAASPGNVINPGSILNPATSESLTEFC